MRYGEGLLDEILRRTDLVQLVGRRVKLVRKGRVMWGCCPFHKEKSPSFKVENERRAYHCFGCGAGGDAFKWLIETEGLSFPEAVQRLAQEAGVALPAWSPDDEAREQRKKSLYEITALAAAFFEDQLRGRAGAAARHYLESRGLSEGARARFHLGYAPDSHGALRDHLAARNVALADMAEAGLIRAAEDGRPARDFFFDRVMFPISDVRGRIVAFGGRGLSPDAKPKYINTGETALFSKGRLLYNFQSAREAALKGAPLIVAEGYMDVIALAENGFGGAVAPLGTALTEDQLALLWKVAPEPILCFDGDEAGTRAAHRAAKLALPLLVPGQSLRFVFLPKGEDPDTFIRARGVIPMRALLDKAIGLSDTLWSMATADRDFSTPERRAGLEAALDETVKAIRDARIADYYRRDFSERVFKAFKQRKIPGFRPPSSAGPRPGPSRTRPVQPMAQPPVSAAVKASLAALDPAGAVRRIKEDEIFGLLLQAPELAERHAETLASLDVMDPELDRIKSELLHLAASGSPLDRTAVETHLVREGLGARTERLKAQKVVRFALEGAAGEAGAEAVWQRAMAQWRNPDFPADSDLRLRRETVLTRYLDGGAHDDWVELQRLNGLLRDAWAAKQ